MAALSLGNLTFNITGASETPTTAGDTVLTNFGLNNQFSIPEWALVFNDTNPNNATLDVFAGSVGSQIGGSVTHTAGTGSNGTVNFTDTTPLNGSFTYQVTDGLLQGTSATVSITNVSTGNNVTGTGANEILIGNGSGTLNGAGGNDVLLGVTGQEQILIGGAGNDVVVYADGQNNGHSATLLGDATAQAAGADGSDTLAFVGAVVATVDLSGATDQTSGDNSDVSGFENVDGSRATTALNLTGSSGANVLKGGSAGDTFVGFVGADTIDGGGGTDTLTLSGTSADLNSATDPQLVNLENITTSAAATINLSNQTEGFTITGSSGADTISGGSGADSITGGAGADTMTGGGGVDTFVINSGQSLGTVGGAGDAGTISGYDVITDFATTGTSDILNLPVTNVTANANTPGTDGTNSTT